MPHYTPLPHIYHSRTPMPIALYDDYAARAERADASSYVYA